MLTSKKSRQFIDYQDSYYYQQQGKKRRRKWLKYSFSLSLLLLLIVVFSLLFVPFTQNSDIDLDNKVTSSNGSINDSRLLLKQEKPSLLNKQ